MSIVCVCPLCVYIHVCVCVCIYMYVCVYVHCVCYMYVYLCMCVLSIRLGEVLSQHNVMCPGLQDKLDRNKSPTDTENKKTVIMDAIR